MSLVRDRLVPELVIVGLDATTADSGASSVIWPVEEVGNHRLHNAG
jgi:hypothetical protein